MKDIKDRNSVETAVDGAGPGRSQALRLDKQTIRTLSGAELKLVAGAVELCIAGSARMCTLPTVRLF
jgi:hypothetical protein